MKKYMACEQFLEILEKFLKLLETSLPKYFALTRIEIVFIKCLLFIFSVYSDTVEFSELVPCSQILPIN